MAERQPPRSYVAYPNGADRTDELAAVSYYQTSGNDGYRWHWTVSIRAIAHDGGRAESKQEAADRAAAAWHVLASAASVVTLGTAERVEAIMQAARLGAQGPLIDIAGERRSFLGMLFGQCRRDFECDFRSGGESPLEPFDVRDFGRASAPAASRH